MNSFHRTILLSLITALTLALAACSGLVAKSDPRPVEVIIQEAETLVLRKAYLPAAEKYATVVKKAPTVGKYYLRYGELLERVDLDKDARHVYRDALDEIPENDPDRVELIHRLALIDANHLYRIDEAEELLHQLPKGSVESYDLAAFLFYHSHQSDEALDFLNKALAKVAEADQKALLMYHAALIYHQIGDVKNTFGSLYHAINLAEHLGLIRDIENFWEEINRDKPLGTGYPQ